MRRGLEIGLKNHFLLDGNLACIRLITDESLRDLSNSCIELQLFFFASNFRLTVKMLSLLGRRKLVAIADAMQIFFHTSNENSSINLLYDRRRESFSFPESFFFNLHLFATVEILKKVKVNRLRGWPITWLSPKKKSFRVKINKKKHKLSAKTGLPQIRKWVPPFLLMVDIIEKENKKKSES